MNRFHFVMFVFAGICLLSSAAPGQTTAPSRPRSAPAIKNGTGTSSPARPPALGDRQIKPAGSDTPQKAATSAATTPGDDEVIQVETNLVTTPVSVMDRNGRFIPGLKKRDFKLSENGVAQKITYFQSEEQAFTVVLVIDASPSTRYKIDEIHYAAVTFVNQLRPNDKVMVVAFDQRVRLLTPEATNDKQILFSAIYKSQFGSGTSLYDAVDAVVRLDLKNVPGRKAVVLFTDGVDTTSRRSSLESSIASVEENESIFYTIRYDTQQQRPGNAGTPAPAGIDLGALLARLPPGTMIDPNNIIVRSAGRGRSSEEYERGRQYLEALATNTGGRMFEADTITNLEAAFSGIAEELRRQYTIGYYPDDTGQPGDRRRIKIEVARPRTVVRAKTSYVIANKAEAENTSK